VIIPPTARAIGIDVHKKFCYACIKDKEGAEVLTRTLRFDGLGQLLNSLLLPVLEVFPPDALGLIGYLRNRCQDALGQSSKKEGDVILGELPNLPVYISHADSKRFQPKNPNPVH
jgi:hypothetical protein